MTINRNVPAKLDLYLKAITLGNIYTTLHITINICGLETLALTDAGKVDITEVVLDVNPNNATTSKQSAGKLIGRTVTEDFFAGNVALVTHTRDAAIDLKSFDTRTIRGLMNDGYRLSHSPES